MRCRLLVAYNILMLDPRIQAKIVSALKKYPIKLAYVYGSYAKGTARPDSDIDIAVVPEDGAEIDEVRLAVTVDKTVKGKDVDIRVIGKKMSLLLSFNAIRLEQPIYVKTEADRLSFERRIINKYFDSQEQERIKQSYLDMAFAS